MSKRSLKYELRAVAELKRNINIWKSENPYFTTICAQYFWLYVHFIPLYKESCHKIDKVSVAIVMAHVDSMVTLKYDGLKSCRPNIRATRCHFTSNPTATLNVHSSDCLLRAGQEVGWAGQVRMTR